MSYLLTEIAMEMLGWQFYDTGGVPRPINLEGLNTATTDGARSLEQALNITFLDKKLSVKAEADSSSIGNDKDAETTEEPFENEQISSPVEALNQDIFGESGDSKSSEDSNKVNWNVNVNQSEGVNIKNSPSNTLDLKIQSVVGGISLEKIEQFPDNEANFHTALPNDSQSTDQELSVLTISKVQKNDAQISAKPNKMHAPNFNVISMTKLPLNESSAQSSLASTSEKKPHNDAPGHLDYLKSKVECEMFKTALDLNREKTLYLKSLDSETKKNPHSFRQAMETYRNREMNKLQSELEQLFQLRQHAEQLAATKFPNTFPKYLKKSNALSSNELLQSTELTIPILHTQAKLKKFSKSTI